MLRDSLQRSLDRASDVESRTLRIGTGPAIPPAKADCAYDLALERLYLRFDFAGALAIAALTQVFELLAKLHHPALVCDLRLLIEHLTGVALRAYAYIGTLAKLGNDFVVR